SSEIGARAAGGEVAPPVERKGVGAVVRLAQTGAAAGGEEERERGVVQAHHLLCGRVIPWCARIKILRAPGRRSSACRAPRAPSPRRRAAAAGPPPSDRHDG